MGYNNCTLKFLTSLIIQATASFFLCCDQFYDSFMIWARRSGFFISQCMMKQYFDVYPGESWQPVLIVVGKPSYWMHPASLVTHTSCLFFIFPSTTSTFLQPGNLHWWSEYIYTIEIGWKITNCYLYSASTNKCNQKCMKQTCTNIGALP